MNTNAKHYEILAIEPWEIMERNFTTEEFVAYLKGNIIKYTLRSKGQDLSDAEKIKHYAEKLIEVLEQKETYEEPKIGVYKPQVKHKFKVGDRVVANKGQYDELTGIVKRLPTEGYQGREFYIIELDLEGEGWTANRVTHGVDCDNAWYTPEDSLTLLEPLKEKSTPALIPNLWYDASLYTVEKLKELLPVGTKVIVTEREDNDRKVNLREEIVREAKVKLVKQRPFTKDTRIGVDNSCLVRRYFKIVKGD